MSITVGVLALQGGFEEHIAHLKRAAKQLHRERVTTEEIKAVEVRTPLDLSRCDALIIPGGESTAMSIIAVQYGLLQPLVDFVRVRKKPTWGTCAGLIMLSQEATGMKNGGQTLVGGLDIRVHRNYFGRQRESFITNVEIKALGGIGGTEQKPFPGVFIRAPVVDAVLPKSHDNIADVQILAVIPRRTCGDMKSASGCATLHNTEPSDIVAVQQGNILGTSFHPELTDDFRLHSWWLAKIFSAKG